jgi:hypothetical protein
MDYAEMCFSTSHPTKAGQIDDEIVKNSPLWMETSETVKMTVDIKIRHGFEA